MVKSPKVKNPNPEEQVFDFKIEGKCEKLCQEVRFIFFLMKILFHRNRIEVE